MTKKPQLCFILPSFHQDQATHFHYTLRLFSEVAKKIPATLLLEDPTSHIPDTNEFEHIYLSPTSNRLGSLVWRMFTIFRLRVAGVKTFYVHYSYFSLWWLWLLHVFMSAKILYWHAEKFSKPEVMELSFVERLMLSISLKLAPVLVTASSDLAKAYSLVFGVIPSQIKIVPNWTEPVVIAPAIKTKLKKKLSIKPKDKVVLFVHRLSPRKGAHILPEIASRLFSRISNAKLLIIGDGPLYPRLKKEFATNPGVQMLGAVPQQEISGYFQIADVFLMPSLREGFPRVIIEAMAHKIPIVATKAGSTEDIVGSSQRLLLLSKASPTLLVEKIETILKMSSPARRKLIQENYDKVVTEYSLTKATQAMIECVK